MFENGMGSLAVAIKTATVGTVIHKWLLGNTNELKFWN